MKSTGQSNHENGNTQVVHYDAVVVGAGFSGLYMLHLFRDKLGLSTRVYDAASNVGGAWYWNRYPGARCDVESIYYQYMFSEEIFKEWNWTNKYPEWHEIVAYLEFVANKLDLNKDIQFNTRVESAYYDEEMNAWRIKTSDGGKVTAKYFITCVGNITAPNIPKFKGLDRFKGKWYHTARWPNEKVDFSGKRVGIIGTGSTGIQAIPEIAKEAKTLTVFQRTPQYTNPARNHPLKPEFIKETKEKFWEIRESMRSTASGMPTMFNPLERSALDDTPEERERVYEEAWQKGGVHFQFTYMDITTNVEANKSICEFIRKKIRETVKDPETVEKLMPSYHFFTKRPVIDHGYYETFNRDNVYLVDLRKEPIEEITTKGVRTTNSEYEVDILVFATGYDTITGALLKMDIRGRNGISLNEKWEGGGNVKTYLGLGTEGFPNMFMCTGPLSPSVFTNMPSAIEQHVEWIADCVKYLQDHNIDTIEVDRDAEDAWTKHNKEVADATLFPKEKNSWYTGGNIEGKPKGFLIYLGGLNIFRDKCNQVAANGYEGFLLRTSTSKV